MWVFGLGLTRLVDVVLAWLLGLCDCWLEVYVNGFVWLVVWGCVSALAWVLVWVCAVGLGCV